MQITLITVGTLKEDYLKGAVCEYEKRLSQYARLESINIKEEKILDEDNTEQIKRALNTEGDKIIKAIPKGATTVALCVEGKILDSIALANYVREVSDASGKLCLIIGSSHGLSDNVKRTADFRLSVSDLTFPHQLMRVILLEALYRSMTIISGKRYHK